MGSFFKYYFLLAIEYMGQGVVDVCLYTTLYTCLENEARGLTSMGRLTPHRAQEEEKQSWQKSVSLTRTHTKTHLRSRFASFQRRSINLKIWRVNMSCLRSRSKRQDEYWKSVSVWKKRQYLARRMTFLLPSLCHFLLLLISTFPNPPPLIPTVSILKDDSQGVSTQQLVVVNNPEGLHL